MSDIGDVFEQASQAFAQENPMTASNDPLREALEQAKAFLVIDAYAPAENKFEIEKRVAYRTELIAKIDRVLKSSPRWR